MTKPFPDNNEYNGFNAPMRLECDITDLVIEGELPKEISGNWYLLTSDHYYPPTYDKDNFFSGDGIITKFAFKDGKADYKLRYVQTDRLKAEKAAGKALFGRYRNPFTSDSSVEGIIDSVVNTTPFWHAGRLFATKESGPAMELDPHTLDTKGWWNYDGKWTSLTHTAHPRIDYDTGELFIFGYEAKGVSTNTVCLGRVNKEGELISEEYFETPYAALMHDFIVTKEHIIFPVSPTTADLDRLKQGGPHFIWEHDKPTYVGIMPRDGSVKEMRWFKKDEALSAFHFMNGFTDGDKVYIDLSYARDCQFPFVRMESEGNPPFDPKSMQLPYVRWEFDLASDNEGWTEVVTCDAVGDFPRVAEKDHMKDYEIGYFINYQPQNGPPEMIGIAHMGFNTLTRLNQKTGDTQHFSFGPGTTVAEPQPVPSKQKGHEGYLLMNVHLHNEHLSDVAVFEAAHVDKGPIAMIKMPVRFRHQTHGWWVTEEQLNTAV